jgi:uncharacterized membrane protein
MIRRGTLLFLIVEALDILTTIVGINYLGLEESNPIANWAGLYGLFAVKIAASLFIVIILQHWRRNFLDFVAVGVAAPAVIWNLTKIF